MRSEVRCACVWHVMVGGAALDAEHNTASRSIVARYFNNEAGTPTYVFHVDIKRGMLRFGARCERSSLCLGAYTT